jgi:hypothetical protein
MFHHLHITFISVYTTSNLRSYQVPPLPHYLYISLHHFQLTFISSSSNSTLLLYQVSLLSPYAYTRIKFHHLHITFVSLHACRIRSCILHHKTTTDFISIDSNLRRRKVEVTHATWSTVTRGSPQCLQGHVS